MYNIILHDGGTKEQTIDRLAKLYDCTTHQSILPKLNILASRYDLELKEWIADGTKFSIVLDNVDSYVKPRRETKDKGNVMYHMVQAIAVADRVKDE